MAVRPESTASSQEFYSPGALIFFAFLGPSTVTFFLWGVNIRRRGGRRIGLAMMAVAGLATVAVLVRSVLDGQIPWSPGGWAVLLVLMKMEFSLHEQDMLRGGTKASWGLPLFGILALITIAVIVRTW